MESISLKDIIGPVMVGPSSSHTAGALRIARMARRLLAQQPASVRFTLYGSFAHTGRGHGTDKALVAGILDLQADDLRIRDSFALAQEAGVAVEMVFDEDTPVAHPNTVDVRAVAADGRVLNMRGVSVGGGAASIRNIDGIDVDIAGDKTSLVVYQEDAKGVLAHIAGCLADHGVNIANLRMYRTRRGSSAFTVMEIDGDIDVSVTQDILDHEHIFDVRVVPAERVEGVACPLTLASVPPIAGVAAGGAGHAGGAAGGAGHAGGAAGGAGLSTGEGPEAGAGAGGSAGAGESPEALFASLDFSTGSQLLEKCSALGLGIGQLYGQREYALRAMMDECSMGCAIEQTDAYLRTVLRVMEESATKPLVNPVKSTGGLIGGEAQALENLDSGQRVVDDLTLSAAKYAMAVLETNAAMGRIVATPTAGSSGVLPAVLLALRDARGYASEELQRALLCAAAVGHLVALNATVSGAEGGCQAEVGAACGMAAAAAVQLAGGSPAQALDAAANAFMSLMGLVCDPVSGLVEVPCQKRNATAAATALVCAQMALAGIGNLVPFDETVAALDAVGRSLPFELRESALGGIAAAPSANAAGGVRGDAGAGMRAGGTACTSCHACG